MAHLQAAGEGDTRNVFQGQGPPGSANPSQPPSSSFLSPPFQQAYYRADPNVRPPLFLSDSSTPPPAMRHFDPVPHNYHPGNHPGAHHLQESSSAPPWGDPGMGSRPSPLMWDAAAPPLRSAPPPDLSPTYYSYLPSSAGPMRRSSSLTATSSTPKSAELSSRDELQSQLAQQQQQDKKRRVSPPSLRTFAIARRCEQLQTPG